MLKGGDIFKICDSSMLVDEDGGITIKEKEFWVLEGLWELLKRNRVNKDHVTSDHLRKYMKILQMTRSIGGISARRCH